MNKLELKYILFAIQASVTIALLFVLYVLEQVAIIDLALFITLDFVLIAVLLGVGVLIIAKTPVNG